MLQTEEGICTDLAVKFGAHHDEGLRSAILEADDLVSTMVEIPLLGCQREALISLVADVVVGRIDGDIEGSKLLRHVNAGEFQLASAEFPKWCLCNRRIMPKMLEKRKAEQELFLGR